MTIKTAEYRPCIVKQKSGNRKALFHRWADYAQVRDAYLQGTTPGQLAQTFAIVEYEDGTVSECYPNQVQFCDNLHAQFDWPEIPCAEQAVEPKPQRTRQGRMVKNEQP